MLCCIFFTQLLAIARKLSLPAESPQEAFKHVLDRILAANLSFWITDYIATACVGSVQTDDPRDALLVDPTFVVSWVEQQADRMQQQLLEASPSTSTQALTNVQRCSKALLQVVAALRNTSLK